MANLLSSDFSSVKIYMHSGITDTVSSSFATPDTASSGMTVETVSGDLLVANYLTPIRVYRQSGISTTTLSSFSYTQSNPKDITLDGSGNLLVADYSDEKVYVMNGLSSTVTNSFVVSLAVWGLTMASEGGC